MRLNHSWIELKLLKHRKDDKIKELTDEINDTQQHQWNFSIRIMGLHVIFLPKQSNQLLNLLS